MFLWKASPRLLPRIWLTISGRNQIMTLRRGTQIQAPSNWRKQASKSSKWSFKTWLSDSSDTLKSSQTVLFVTGPNPNKLLLLMRMWLGYASTIGLLILPLQSLWPIGSVQAAAQLQISLSEDKMHWLDGCAKISVVGGYVSGTLQGGRRGDDLEFVGEVERSLFGLPCILLFHLSYSCMKVCIESSWCWDWLLRHLFLRKT